MKREIEIKCEMFRFTSKQNWINTAQTKFSGCAVRSSDYICIDMLGNVCRKGREFANADNIDSYPVIVYELK